MKMRTLAAMSCFCFAAAGVGYLVECRKDDEVRRRIHIFCGTMGKTWDGKFIQVENGWIRGKNGEGAWVGRNDTLVVDHALSLAFYCR